ncbi:hypothetical protein B0H19DRAFT_1029312 [Mycena capillaripes]|nr:hypothetical protein B0H19DRAFT_1029312 [Mycena capillaripes]
MEYGQGARDETSRRHKHVCPKCGKRFRRPSSLKIHVNTHTGEMTFHCPQPGCRRAFNVKSNMRRHLRTHTGVASTPGLDSASSSTKPKPKSTSDLDYRTPSLLNSPSLLAYPTVNSSPQTRNCHGPERTGAYMYPPHPRPPPPGRCQQQGLRPVSRESCQERLLRNPRVFL